MSAITKLIRLWGMDQWIVFLGLIIFLKLLFKFQLQWFIGIGLGKMIIRSHSFSSYQILAQNLFSPFTRKEAWKGVILYFKFLRKNSNTIFISRFSMPFPPIFISLLFNWILIQCGIEFSSTNETQFNSIQGM